MLNFWTVRFFKTESELYGFSAHPYWKGWDLEAARIVSLLLFDARALSLLAGHKQGIQHVT